MIRLKQRWFRGEFLPTFEKLMSQPGLNQKVAYNLAKLAPKIKKAAQAAQLEFFSLVDQFAIKDEKGEVKPYNGPNTFEIAPEKREAWDKALALFEDKEVMIDRQPFMIHDFTQATLTPNDYLALEPLIHEMGIVPDETSAGPLENQQTS